ncbi:RRXRR domain-containing protein [Allobaculum sp. JKK-2023]|nr:RRXRR domain-containing protein [Allobaculum sp. JKK-2023]
MSEALTYVLDVDGNPLMPTRHCKKVFRFLKAKKAEVVKRTPFTIQL